MKSKPPSLRGQIGKFDPIHVTAPLLFVSLNRKSKQRETGNLQVIYTPVSKDKAVTFEFFGPNLLGVDDLRVFQGLIGVGTEQNRELARSRVVKDVDNSINVPEPFAGRIVVSCSFGYLARVIGYKAPESGATVRVIKDCLSRMSSVSISYRASDTNDSISLGSLITNRDTDYLSDGLSIELNSSSTAAVLASNKNEQYFKMNLDEVRKLRTDSARLIHHRLHYLKEGGSIQIRFDTLAGYVWPPTDSKNAQRKRLEAVRKVLFELASIDWKHKVESESTLRIFRPHVPQVPQVAQKWA
jgi:hypothetical protein